MGFLQALGVTSYCLLVGGVFLVGDAFFGKMGGFLGPAMMLILFSVSALVCGLLVFYQPYQLFFDGKRKETTDLVLYTTGWLAIFFFTFLLLVILTG